MNNVQGLNGLGSPFGIETICEALHTEDIAVGLNGLGSPFGIETRSPRLRTRRRQKAKWPGEPVRD